jgi:hypothetical protein
MTNGRADLRVLLDELPETSLVLDVGGWSNPNPRANWVIDLGSYDTRGWYEWGLGAKLEHDSPERYTPDTWLQIDACGPDPWPFDDGMFDFAICSHTLEDVRDPIRVCSELMRVSKSGYIETPAAVTELTRGIQSPLWCGWNHHRWLIERDGEGLVFRAKPHHVHSPLFPAVRSPRRLRLDAASPLRFAWHGPFPAREAVTLTEWDELDQALLAIIARDSKPDPIGTARRGSLRVAWSSYARTRAGLGGLRRRFGPWPSE